MESIGACMYSGERVKMTILQHWGGHQKDVGHRGGQRPPGEGINLSIDGGLKQVAQDFVYSSLRIEGGLRVFSLSNPK